MSKPEKSLSTKSAYTLVVTLLVLLLIPATISAIINSRPSPPVAATCFDFSGDGRVDQDDENLLMEHNKTEEGKIYKDRTYDPRFDLNGDGKINSKDRDILRDHLGETCPPTVSFSATKTRINKGASSTLRWSTTRTSSVSISRVGSVSKSGSKIIKPAKTTTYKITVKGPGGTRTKSIKVTVVIPSSGAPLDSSVTATTPLVESSAASDSSVTRITVKINPLAELSGELKIKLSIDGVRFSREVTLLKTTKEVIIRVPEGTLELNKTYALKIAGEKLLTKKTRFKSSKSKVTVKMGSLYLGDLDENNSIGDSDIALIAGDFSEGGLSDLNFDGVVNSLDYSILLKNLGKKGS